MSSEQAMSSTSMEDLVGSRIYSCFKCHNLVALHDDIVNKDFRAGEIRAFLFSHAMNIVEGAKEDRQLISGVHMIADVYCSDCHELLGWKYQQTYQERHKYKEGKIVFIKFKITKAIDPPFY